LGINHINFSNFQPAFGRQEEIILNNKIIKIILSKNPTGFNQTIRTLDEFSKDEKTILLVLNDRIPDGRDISWIWDVDFENLKSSKVFISGDRCFDMGLRIKYADIKNYYIDQNLRTCLLKALEDTETLYILPTYSAMLEVRKILSGKKIL
jgi:lipid II isoglutaminyl synthase (glutamine-hydrolysing)